MSSVLDLWRATDPEARLVSGSVDHLTRSVRGVARTRASPPHLPDLADGQLLVVDAAVVADGRTDALVGAVQDAGLAPCALWVAGDAMLERAGSDLPILHAGGSAAATQDAMRRHLEEPAEFLRRVAGEIRLAGAEAALADPRPAAPAGVVAARLRRGVAVSVGGSLEALMPRPAGRALATRFAAAHARLLADSSGSGARSRRTRDGLWVLERPVTQTTTAWLFDDLPFAAIDEAALASLVITLRALLRRAPPGPARARAEARQPPSTGDPMRDTLLAVARANGRIAPAARVLGVHRNTVLYRLRRASAEYGIDPRRSADALRLLQEARTD